MVFEPVVCLERASTAVDGGVEVVGKKAGGGTHSQKSNCVDGQLVYVGVAHDCD